ncbi:unnamed protein product [Ectocarpus sp. 6 AP-2014]
MQRPVHLICFTERSISLRETERVDTVAPNETMNLMCTFRWKRSCEH